jgi:hypothetical protein
MRLWYGGPPSLRDEVVKGLVKETAERRDHFQRELEVRRIIADNAVPPINCLLPAAQGLLAYLLLIEYMEQTESSTAALSVDNPQRIVTRVDRPLSGPLQDISQEFAAIVQAMK